MVERDGATSSAGKLGLIMEIEGRHAVVLTPEGEFRRVRLDRSDRQVGEEIPLVAGVSRLRSWPYLGHSVALATAAAALLLAMIVPRTFIRPETGPGSRVEPPAGPAAAAEPVPAAPAETTPVAPVPAVAAAILAYVSVDINPSVELGVGTGGVVVSADALNDDAAGIVADLVYRDRPVDDVITDITRLALALGFITAEKENVVVIAAVPAQEGASVPAEVAERVVSARDKAREFLRSRRVAGEVEAVSFNRAVLKAEAQELDMSVGRYLIYLEVSRAGLAVEPEDLRAGAIGRVLRERGVRPGEVMRQLSEEDGDELLDWAKEIREQVREQTRPPRLDRPERLREIGESDRRDSPGDGSPDRNEGDKKGEGREDGRGREDGGGKQDGRGEREDD